MTIVLNAVFMIILALNLFILGTSRIITIIRIVAVQGVLLGIITLMIHDQIEIPVLIAAGAAIGLKGIVIPIIMMRALRSAQIKREVEPLIGIMPSILIGAGGTALSLIVFSQTAIAGKESGLLIIPSSIATVFIGFIVLTTRFKAITQVLGYLILENGIFIFSLLLIKAIPLVVEMGMLLDLFVGVFVISIITNHINRAFSSMDTRKLSSLKEE